MLLLCSTEVLDTRLLFNMYGSSYKQLHTFGADWTEGARDKHHLELCLPSLAGAVRRLFAIFSQPVVHPAEF